MPNGQLSRIATHQLSTVEPSVTMMVSFLNNENFASRTLLSMLKTQYANLHFILIYNPSKDRTLDIIKGIIKDVSNSRCKLVINECIKPFDDNLNEALTLTDDEYFIGANSDLLFEDAFWLKKLLSVSTRLPSLGAISPCLLNWNDSSVQSCGGLRVPFTFEVRNFVPTHENSVYEIFAINGSLFMGKTSTFKRVGGFWHNEDLKNPCGGDIEFSLRLRRNGYKLYSTNLVKSHHLGGGTLGRTPRKSALLNYSSFLKINRSYVRSPLKLSAYNTISYCIMKWRLLRSRSI